MRLDGERITPFTEREKRQFVEGWVNYALSQGAIFPNGRPDQMEWIDLDARLQDEVRRLGT